MTRNRQSVILTKAANAIGEITLALAILPPDQWPAVHVALNDALHSALIIAEEVRQEWKRGVSEP
jgi:hypothetical protein